MDVYVYNKNLQLVSIIDSYKSLIWANRYKDIGDCELYLEANEKHLTVLKMGYYLARPDDSMVCQIRKIQIDTDVEDGNYMIVSGVDTKALIDQRVVWNMENCTGKVEDFIRKLVNESCIVPSGVPDRRIRKQDTTVLMKLGSKANFTEVTTEQVSYKNIGEKIREYCETYKWGYRLVMDDGQLAFELYKGTDRRNSVIFSDDYENLSSSSYVDDKTHMGNVALVAGSGEGSDRVKTYFGVENGIERFEIFVDAKDVSQQVTYSDVRNVYPLVANGGQGYLDGNIYKNQTMDIEIVTEFQLLQLQDLYPSGEIVTIDGNEYYRATNVIVATLESSTPDDSTNALWSVPVYTVFLLNRGAEKTAEFGEVKTFNGSVIPDVTFVYKRDYFLGDIVTVQNEYGLTAYARIVEVIEVYDDNGYSVEPKFESEV